MSGAAEQRKLAAIMFTDMVGYTALSQSNAKIALELLEEHRQLLREIFPKFNGSEIKTIGDAFLVEFNSALEAAQCAIAIQRALAKRDADAPAERQIQVRIGIHIGDVVHRGGDVYGDGVNIASRIEPLADAGGICVSMDVERQIRNALETRFEKLAPTELKNISVPMDLFRIVLPWEHQPQLTAKFRTVAPPKTAQAKWIIAVAAVVIAGAAFFAYQLLRSRTASHLQGGPTATSNVTGVQSSISEKSIAVLPFENLSEDKSNAFFADGVQDEILTDLAKVADLKVISRTSVIGYRDTAGRNLRKIGQELGVAHLVEGSVQRSGNRVRINAQLVDARTDAHQWAQTFDRDLADIFAIQSEIAKAIADQLRAELSPREKAEIERAPTTNLAAFELYTQARQLSERGSYSTPGSENSRQAEALLKQALALDPNFFLAHCLLQYVSDNFYFFNTDRTPARRAVGEAALQAAIRLNPNAGETHLAIADHLYRINLDYDGARAELEKAKQALPNSSQVYEWTGYIDRRQGRWEDSLRNHRRSLELDPRNHFLYQQVSLTYDHLRRYREMAAALDKTLELIPNDIETRVARAVVDFDGRADTDPLYRTIHDILATTPGSESTVAEQWIWLSQARRDVAEGERAAASVSKTGVTRNGLVFPRPFFQALFAQLKGDRSATQDHLLKAREETEAKLQAAPDYGPTLVILGLIDAALGRKEDAIREGKRATEQMPITRKSIEGAQIITYLAVIYAWTGEKDLAIERLEESARIPAGVGYGELKLLPYFDSLRGDSRFEKIVASLAPKQ
jgi:TolB-like protein/class 3 adenylate cyclase